MSFFKRRGELWPWPRGYKNIEIRQVARWGNLAGFRTQFGTTKIGVLKKGRGESEGTIFPTVKDPALVKSGWKGRLEDGNGEGTRSFNADKPRFSQRQIVSRKDTGEGGRGPGLTKGVLGN